MPSAPLLALAFVAGTMAAAVLGGPWWASMAVAAACAGAWRLTSSGGPTLVFVAAVALVGAGHARWAAADGAPAPAIASIEGTHVIEGLVSTEPTLTGAFARFDLEVRAIDGVATRAGGVRVTVRTSSRASGVPRAGDLVRLSGGIERPPEIEEFDYAAYLRSAGIHAVVGFPRDLEVLAEDTGAAHTRALRALRRGAVANIERALPEPAAALATGMLAGERRAIPDPLRDALRITGTSHLVVVSGQNVALLLGSAIALLTLVTLTLLPAYVALVGGEPPVVRAALMAVGIALGGVLGRRTPGWVYLAYAVALMLALDPGLARSAAFQLSASATAGVLVIAPPLRDALLAWTRTDVDGAGAALAEVAATAAGAALAVLPRPDRDL